MLGHLGGGEGTGVGLGGAGMRESSRVRPTLFLSKVFNFTLNSYWIQRIHWM